MLSQAESLVSLNTSRLQPFPIIPSSQVIRNSVCLCLATFSGTPASHMVVVTTTFFITSIPHSCWNV